MTMRDQMMIETLVSIWHSRECLLGLIAAEFAAMWLFTAAILVLTIS